MIARVVQAEAGNQEFVGLVAVAATVFNRMDMFGMTAEQVLTQKNQYTSPWQGAIPAETVEAVRFARENRGLFPQEMIYFRAGDYHKHLGKPYIQIGDHYFSVSE